MANCSDSFPSTEVFYAEISSDVPIIVLLAVACVLTLVICALFVDEHVYLRKIHTNNPLRQRRVVTLLGLYPMISGMSLLSLLVPACTQMVDLIASCYLSVCIYMFVSLMVEYFGGGEKMVEALANDKIRMNTPPCCCCCCCLPQITLTKRSLYYIELLALQVAIIRPLLLFIAAVLWTDGKYVQGELGLHRPATYITNISTVSTLLSVYAQFLILTAMRPRMRPWFLRLKLLCLNFTLLLFNLQTFVFGLLAHVDVIPCVGSRGPLVRASSINHGILVIEMFLLSLLARYCYRRPNPDHEPMPETMSTATLRSSVELLDKASTGALKSSREDLNVPVLGFSNVTQTTERAVAIDNGIQLKKGDAETKDRSNPVVFTLGDKINTDKQLLSMDKKKKTSTNPRSAALYISILSGASTLLSMYGMIVIFRNTNTYMTHQRLAVKFFALQVAVVLHNIQPLIFGILARFDIPGCVQSRGTKVRASNLNHAVLIIEMLLLCLLARFAYRRPDPDSETELTSTTNGIKQKYANSEASMETNSSPVGHYRTYDNQAMSLDEHAGEVKYLS